MSFQFGRIHHAWVDRAAGRVSAGIQWIKLAGIGHRNNLDAELAGQQPGTRDESAMIAPAAVNHEDADLLAIGTDGVCPSGAGKNLR